MAREGKWDREKAINFLRGKGVGVVDLRDEKSGKVTRTVAQTPVSLRILGARDYLVNYHKFILK
jgi:hypothetical protein